MYPWMRKQFQAMMSLYFWHVHPELSAFLEVLHFPLLIAVVEQSPDQDHGPRWSDHAAEKDERNADTADNDWMFVLVRNGILQMPVVYQ